MRLKLKKETHVHVWADPSTCNLMFANKREDQVLTIFCEICRKEHIMTEFTSKTDQEKW